MVVNRYANIIEKTHDEYTVAYHIASGKITNAIDYHLSKNEYNEIEECDSIAHMTLVAALEEEFKITMETDDIIDFSSFKKGIEILKKYKVTIS